VMYVTTPAHVLIALDATNGKELWRFVPDRGKEKFTGINRGVAYWHNGDESSILYTVSNYLYRVDAQTGKAVEAFGDEGRANLNEGLLKEADKMAITSPGAPNIYKNLLILGAVSWSAPSNVSAFDIKTGKRVWVFNSVPRPGEYGYDSWGNKNFWKDGAGVNSWGGIAVDDENGMVYFSTGQPKDDFYRSDNKGQQLYGNCIVAVNAETGKRVWHYQALHHDLWDLDMPCAPVLVNLTDNGKAVKGVMQLTKTGNILLFDRLTGRVLSKVDEVPVPASTLPGEYAYPTQPKVTWPEPFSRQVVKENELTNRTPEAHTYAKKIFSASDAGWFIPPNLKGILYYGIHGGSEWGGGAYDEQENTLYINANELAWHIKMRDINENADAADKSSLSPGNGVFLKMGCSGCHGADRAGQGGIPNLTQLDKKYTAADIEKIVHNGRKAMPAFKQIQEKDMKDLVDFLLNKTNTAQAAIVKNKPEYRSLGYNKFLDQDGYPATAPPWGTLNAVDLTTGAVQRVT
ncbi:MAG: c-type cytochrome, partial [Sphingobacteriales bacterium]